MLTNDATSITTDPSQFLRIKTQIFWDLNIHTDRVIEVRRPDIAVVDKQSSEAVVLNIAVPKHFRRKVKEFQQLVNYQDLAIKTTRMWNIKTRGISL